MTDIVFDIGGTNMRVAAVRDGKLGEVLKIATPPDPEAGVHILGGFAFEAAAGEKVSAICGSLPGVITNGSAFHLSHLPRWDGFTVAEHLTQDLKVPAYVVNDAALAGLGEAHYGAGKGSVQLVYVTISTGLGMGRIVNGVIEQGVYNSEPGHQIMGGIDQEIIVSGCGIQERFGVSPKDFSDAVERTKIADNLATILYNTTLHWSPDTIILGGPLIVGENPLPLDRIEETFKKLVLGMYPTAPVLKKATLGDEGGLWGAVAYLAQQG